MRGWSQCCRSFTASHYQLPGREKPLVLQSAAQVESRRAGLVPGFMNAAEVVTSPVYPGPVIPPEYNALHRFPAQAPVSESTPTYPICMISCCFAFKT